VNPRTELLALLEESDLMPYEIQNRFGDSVQAEVVSSLASMLEDGTLDFNGEKLTLSRASRIALSRDRTRTANPAYMDRYSEKRCELCRSPYKPKAGNQQFCPACQKKRIADRNRRYWARRKAREAA
jgi:hypothetical protein